MPHELGYKISMENKKQILHFTNYNIISVSFTCLFQKQLAHLSSCTSQETVMGLKLFVANIIAAAFVVEKF